MMFQIFFDHFFRHLSYHSAVVASRPKVSSPIAFLQMGKFFKQIARRSPFNSPHNLTRRYIRWRTHQNMYMIFTHYSSDNPNLKGFRGLPSQFPNSFDNLTFQNFIAIFRHPYKVILNLENRLTTVSVFHSAPPYAPLSLLKPVV